MEGSNHSIIWDSILVSTGWTDKNTRTFCRIVRLLGEIPPKTWIQCRRDNHLRSMFVCFWCNSPQWARASSFTRFLDHTQRRTTVDRTPLDEWSARRRDLYLTTHNNHNKHPCPPDVLRIFFLFTLKNPTASAGFEPANLGTKGQHATSRPPKPLSCIWDTKVLACHAHRQRYGLNSGVAGSNAGHIIAYLYRLFCGFLNKSEAVPWNMARRLSQRLFLVK